MTGISAALRPCPPTAWHDARVDVPDLSGYRPSAEVLRRVRDVTFVAVVGPSAAGKTTVINAARRRDTGLHFIRTDLDREPRQDEQDGVDLHFRTRAEMLAGIRDGRFLTVVAHLSGHLYATDGAEYRPGGLAIMPVLSSALPVFRALPFRSQHTVFLTPPSYSAWMTRLASRQFAEVQRAQRLAEARQSLEFALADPAVRHVISDDVGRATDDLLDLVHGDAHAAQPEPVAQRARATIRELLRQLRGPVAAPALGTGGRVDSDRVDSDRVDGGANVGVRGRA